MNKQLSEMPNLGGEIYAPVTPKWFTNLLRMVSVIFALAMAWFGIHDWENMPVWVQLLLCLLVPAFFFSAFHPKGWAQYSTTPFFLADYGGMYFKHKHALTTHLGKDAEIKNKLRKTWLFVPWQNISNIRLARVATHDGTFNGAVLDVKATDEELDEFFAGRQTGRNLPQDGSVPVAFYMNLPPSPSKVVADLQVMMDRYKKSDLSAKYTKFK